MPDKKIIDAVIRSVRQCEGWPQLRVLDLSCGDGHVLEALARDGARVEGTHYRTDDYIFKSPAAIVKQVKIHQGVDLSRTLPFADASYDVVLATEVMEHLPNHAVFCAEAARIVRPGGWFICSTPNVHRLQSRVQFMLTGQHELRSARLGWDIPASDLYTTHYNPVYFPVLHTLLHFGGMHVQRLVFTTCKRRAVLYAPLYPLVALAAALETRHARKRNPAGGRDLLRWMRDPRLLFSDQLMIVARKTEPVRP